MRTYLYHFSWFWLLPGTVFLLAGTPPLQAAPMQVVPPTGNDPQGNPLLRPHADCTGVTQGGTDLWQGGTLRVLDVTAGNWPKLWQPIWNDVKNQFSRNWTWQGGASLGGTLYLDAYQAFDKQEVTQCMHWAELLAHYEGITVPAGEKVEWVQVYRKSGAAQDPPGYGHPPGWSFDPPANVQRQGKTMDQAPFYYNEGEMHYRPQTEIPDSALFWDQPRQEHLERNNWSGGLEFDLFLVSWDGSYDETKPHTITVHDGFAWGFQGYCVPEPSALVLLTTGVLTLLTGRRSAP